jgi:hypothetical protein
VNFVKRLSDRQSVNCVTLRYWKMDCCMILEALHMQNGVHVHINLFAVSHPAQSLPGTHYSHLMDDLIS